MKPIIRLLVLLLPYSGWMLGGIFISLLALLANISLMAISGWFIASMAIAGLAGVSMNYFSPAAMIRAAAILRTAGRYAERLITHEATFRLLTSVRVWFYRQLEPLVPGVIANYRSGDLFSRIQSDIDSLNDFYIRIVVPVVVALFTIVILFLIVSLYHIQLAIILGGMLLLAAVFFPVVVAWLGYVPGSRHVQQKAALRIATIDGVQGLAELMVLGAVPEQEQQVKNCSDQVIATQRRLSAINGISTAVMTFLPGMTMVIILIVAIPLAVTSEPGLAELQLAEIAMLALLSLAAFESAIPLTEAFRLLGQVKTAASRLFELVDQKPSISEPEQKQGRPELFNWQFKSVDFLYEYSNQTVLKDINLSIEPGKKIAIVGPTGAGKSTILQLLLKHQLATAGQVLLAGKSIEHFSSQDLYEWISVVPQQIYLFNTTIEDNLKVARHEANEPEIQKTLEIACLDEFVATQPKGLKTQVGESGVKLSGGQIKRLAIARALLKDHQLLLMDEPTENLDGKTAKKVMENIFSDNNTRSIVVITHQFANLKAFDEIIYLDEGKVLHRGSYDQMQEVLGNFKTYLDVD